MHDGEPDLLGGQRGEHRMAELVVPLPAERISEIHSCVAILSCDYELVLSQQILPGESGDLYFADGAAHIVLWQRLTLCRALRVQLECYGLNGEFIDRTRISEPIIFRKSLADSLDEIAEVPEQAGVIAQLLAAMHSHGNKTVLDELGELAGASSELLRELSFTLIHT
jgi:hypothetical protein